MAHRIALGEMDLEGEDLELCVLHLPILFRITKYMHNFSCVLNFNRGSLGERGGTDWKGAQGTFPG